MGRLFKIMFLNWGKAADPDLSHFASTSVVDLDAMKTDTDPDPAFPVNPDPVPDLGFWWLKIVNNTAEKRFYQKLIFIYPPDV